MRVRVHVDADVLEGILQLPRRLLRGVRGTPSSRIQKSEAPNVEKVRDSTQAPTQLATLCHNEPFGCPSGRLPCQATASSCVEKMCKNFARIVQELCKICARIAQELCKNFARVVQESRNHCNHQGLVCDFAVFAGPVRQPCSKRVCNPLHSNTVKHNEKDAACIVCCGSGSSVSRPHTIVSIRVIRPFA